MARRRGHWEQVIEYSQKIIALNPHLPQAYLGLGEAYRVLGDSKAGG